MKKRFRINGKSFNLLGVILFYAIIVMMTVSCFLIIGFTGGCEHDMLSCTEYLVRVIPCVIVLALCAYLYVELYDYN